jgi:hypothetical protein
MGSVGPGKILMRTRTYSFSCLKVCRSHRVEGRELWTLTVLAKDLPLGFKYGPNARFAELNTKAAKEMLETLATDPGVVHLQEQRDHGRRRIDQVRGDGSHARLQ